MIKTMRGKEETKDRDKYEGTLKIERLNDRQSDVEYKIIAAAENSKRRLVGDERRKKKRFKK